MKGGGNQKRQLAMRLLVAKAGVQGYLTSNDLMEVFPDASKDEDRLSELFTVLRRRGIDIIDSDDRLTDEPVLEALDPSPDKPASAIELNLSLERFHQL